MNCDKDVPIQENASKQVGEVWKEEFIGPYGGGNYHSWAKTVLSLVDSIIILQVYDKSGLPFIDNKVIKENRIFVGRVVIMDNICGSKSNKMVLFTNPIAYLSLEQAQNEIEKLSINILKNMLCNLEQNNGLFTR